MTKVKVAIMGGAYDMPHLGHMLTAKTALALVPSFSLVYWTPCGQHVHGKKMTEGFHRLRMCAAAIKDGGDDRIQLFDHEFAYNLTGETYKLALSVREVYPDLDFSFIIGMDNANTMTTWKHHEQLTAEFPFVVMSREGVEPDPAVDWYKKGHHTFLDAAKPLPAIGSRDIRPLIADGKYDEARKFVCKPVLDYIVSHNLYRNKP